MIEKNLTEFETHNEYVNYTGGTSFIRPNISYCDDKDEVHYSVEVTGVTISESAIELITGNEYKLKAQVLPTCALVQDVIWSSSDESIATVDQDGVVRAVAIQSGVSIITVTTVESGFTIQCTCTVLPVPVTGVSISETEISMYDGGTHQLSATVYPEDASLKTVTWSSSDDEVATVTQDGFVEAVGLGFCDIIVTTDDGGYTANCRVKIDPAENYLTFIPETARTFKFSPANSNVVEYSVNAGNDWTAINAGEETPTVEAKKKILWRCNAISGTNIGVFVDDVKTNFKVQGNAMSMIYGDDFIDKTDMQGNTFREMFKGCYVSSASGLALPAEEVPNYGYYGMFSGCTYLTSMPELPATSIGTRGYAYMFYSASRLTSTLSELPLETIPVEGCMAMFHRSGLSTLPRIIASSIGASGLQLSFSETKISTIPQGYKLSATTVGERAYVDMFNGCGSLTTVPEDLLPLTTLSDGAYYGMFRYCGRLTNIPDLPAEIIPRDAYRFMFSNCTSLTSFDASKMSGNTFTGNWSCDEMFAKCTSLTAITNPLLFTSVMESDLRRMFSGCTHLTSVPGNFLSQVTSVGTEGCHGMFGGCSALTSVSTNFLPATTVGASGYQEMFASCTSLTNVPSLPATTLQSGGYRQMFSGCTSLTTLPIDLLPATSFGNGVYYQMFYGCSNITNVPSLPCTKMTTSCYYGMFARCTSLVTVPYDLLPAVGYRRAFYSEEDGIYDECYESMFEGCTKLENAPDLETTDYYYLETSPSRREHRNKFCYRYMFSGCTSLKYIRCLGAYRTDSRNYNTNECLSASNGSSYSCNWVKGVPTGGTFVYRDGVSWSTGDSGCPAGWTKVIDGQQ